MKKQINIDGMSCSHCVKHVTEALEELKGVTSVNVSLEDKNAVIEAENDIDDETLKAAVEDAGYDVTSIA